MKKLAVLALALTMALGAAAPASAVDVRVGGEFINAFYFFDHAGGMHDDTYNDFEARLRFRTWADFIVSESLSGHLHFEIGEANYGNVGETTAGGWGLGNLGARGVAVEVRRAYVDWVIPGTAAKVRMGIQPFAMPNISGKSPVVNDDMAGVSISNKFNDMVSATLFWARPYNTVGNNPWSGYNETQAVGDGWDHSKFDLIGLTLPLSFNGVNFTPWAMYGIIGSQSHLDPGGVGNSMHDLLGAKRMGGGRFSVAKGPYDYAWWAGALLDITALDPFQIKIEADYGALRAENNNNVNGTSGFWIGAAVDYKTDWGVPGLFAWYASGDDEDKQKQMFNVAGPGINFLSFGQDGSNALAGGSQFNNMGIGQWAIGLQVKDISFVKDMTHLIRVAYLRGTNDKDAPARLGYTRGPGYMTTKDAAFEIDFHTQYNIYKELAALVEFGYIIPDFGNPADDVYDENAFRAAISLNYTF